jgi:hypothetical protein
MRVGALDRLVVAIAALEPDDLDGRVSIEQSDQLGADVARRPDDPDAQRRTVARRPIDPLEGGRLDPCAHRRTVASGDGSFTEDGLEGLTA